MQSVFVWTPGDVIGLILLVAIFIGALISALVDGVKSRKRK